jgi:CzcA family heavy metal efflux pump
MLRGIVGWSLKFRFLVVVIAAAVMAFGIAQLRDMPVDVLPEFSPPYVEIQTEALGLSAEEVEQMITVPMEQDLLAGVAWLDVIRSESVPGLSSVVVYFEPGTDLYKARQMVSERLSQAAVGLPHVSKPPTMIQPLSSASRFIIVGLSSQELSPIQMSVLARWVIAPRMMAVPGVSNVAIWGQRDRQLQVQVDPERLRAQGVSLQDVINTTGNALWVSSLSYLEASTPGTGGFIDTPQQRLGVWHVLPISSPEELAQVPVEGSESLTLGDVADVVEDHQPLIGDAITNDNPSLLLVIEKLPGANTLKVTRGVEEAVAALQPGMTGIEFDTTLYRPASYIEMAMANLSRILLIAAVLVVVVLLALLWSWRVALISLVAILLSLLAAVVMLYLRGATLNTMVLVGLVIALGAVVDDAIVDVENIARRLREHRKEGGDWSTADIVREASVEMRSPVIFATLILLLAAVPLFFLDGVSGALFRPLVTSYVLAVLVSLVVALIVTPPLSLILLSGMSKAAVEQGPDAVPGRRGSPLLSWLQRGYGWALTRIVRKARPALWGAVVAIIVVAGLGVWLPLKLRQESPSQRLAQEVPLPAFQEPYLTIQWEGAPGTSHPEMERILARASSELQQVPGIRNVSAHVGRAVFGDQVVGINSAELWVGIDPAADYDTTVAAVQKTADGYAGLDQKVSTYLRQTVSQPHASAGDGITVRVFGEDPDVLRSEAEKVRQALAGIAGAVDPHVVLPTEEPTLEIEVDLASAQTHGIKPGDVRRAAATLLSGLQVGSLFEQQKVFDVVVWSTPETRESLTAIHDLLIDAPDGGHVRLGAVAYVRMAPSATVIRREGVSPYRDVVLRVQGRSPRAVANDVHHALQGMQFPLEYHAEVLGDYAARQVAQQRILLAVLIAVIGGFLLLQAALGSWRLALVAFLTLPVALAGGMIVAAFVSSGASLGSLLGLFTILAIAVRNGVVLISHYQRLEQDEGEAFGPELVLRGSRERVAPILLTAFTMALAFLPFAIAGNIPGNEIVGALAVVVLGGLVTTTLLNLFLMPALYLRFGANPEPVAPRLPTIAPETPA